MLIIRIHFNDNLHFSHHQLSPINPMAYFATIEIISAEMMFCTSACVIRFSSLFFSGQFTALRSYLLQFWHVPLNCFSFRDDIIFPCIFFDLQTMVPPLLHPFLFQMGIHFLIHEFNGEIISALCHSSNLFIY